VRAQGKKGGAGAKKEGAKAPKEKRDKVKAAAPPKDLTGKGAEKTEQQLKAEEGAGVLSSTVLRASFVVPLIANAPLHSPPSLLLISCTRRDRRQDPETAGACAGRHLASIGGRGQRALRHFPPQNQPYDSEALGNQACRNSEEGYGAQKQSAFYVSWPRLSGAGREIWAAQ